MTATDYWHGMVMCQRKALSHVSFNSCLSMNTSHPEACGGCVNHQHVVDAIIREQRQEEERKKSCQNSASHRGS